MLISVRWLNTLLNPGDLTANEAERALTAVGFPIESAEPLPDGDTRLDVEITSNRGDCMSHLGIAREIAACTGRELLVPDATLPAPSGAPAAESFAIDNRVPDECPRFTARLIRGVKAGPSPGWLVRALESVGQRSINNVVDITNFVLFELGNPSHTFDLRALRGERLTVRYASKGETLETLDGRKHTLREDEVVIADDAGPTSLAGVMGGEASSVTEKTVDVLLEVATWAPSAVRRAVRRLNLRSDASARFERFVDARTLEYASARAAKLILDVAGGSLAPGMIEVGAPLPDPTVVDMRVRRCCDILGVEIPPPEMARLLTAIDIDAHVRPPMGDVDTPPPADANALIRCEIPPHRPDLTREIDLVEEVARTHGFDRIPTLDAIPIVASPLPAAERAMRELRERLVGMGFFETVTFSFIAPGEASMFLPEGLRALAVDEERRKGEPSLRPSVIPSLLRCRRSNQDARSEHEALSSFGSAVEPQVRLFEVASVYAEDAKGATVEHRNLALVLDAPEAQAGVRALRGAIETLARALAGPGAEVVVEKSAPFAKAFSDVFATLTMGGEPLGYMAMLSPAAMKHFDLQTPVVVAEVGVAPLIAKYPPAATVDTLPAFPAIERDLSVVVDEPVAWSDIEQAVDAAAPAMLDGVAFVGVFRGKQVGPGRKSVTFRMRFRAPDRTLRHEEVDPQVASVVERLRRDVAAELRA